jgi:serine/threonine protein kinase
LQIATTTRELRVNLPDRIGPYKPLRRIGAGGMGTVYFAYHPATGAPTAVKALRADYATDASYRARFTREVTVLRKVSGPYLVPLTDADTHGDLPWLAMPYVTGNTLHQHIQSHGPLQGSNLITFAAAVAHALSCIHMAGVAHRDLKPTNVILAVDGPRVVDFGIAHHLDATAITATSTSPGTPGWMAAASPPPHATSSPGAYSPPTPQPAPTPSVRRPPLTTASSTPNQTCPPYRTGCSPW